MWDVGAHCVVHNACVWYAVEQAISVWGGWVVVVVVVVGG